MSILYKFIFIFFILLNAFINVEAEEIYFDLSEDSINIKTWVKTKISNSGSQIIFSE